MSDKLEALSQPVAVMFVDGDILNKAQCGETFDICCQAQSPLYSQEYVTALLVNLKAEKQCKDAATANLTAASTCISELSNRVHSLLAALEEKDQRNAELNVKLFDQSILLDAAISRAEAAETSLTASREVVALYDERLKEAEQRTEASGRREEHLKATVDVLSAKNAELERITEGVDQLAIDGGWTARGMSEYAKARDAENQDLMLTVGRLRTERTELEQRLQQPIAIPAGFRIVPIKATREQLAAVQVAGKSVVYTDMVLAAPEHPGFKVEGE